MCARLCSAFGVKPVRVCQGLTHSCQLGESHGQAGLCCSLAAEKLVKERGKREREREKRERGKEYNNGIVNF